jgi:glucosamine kinase
LSEKILGLGIDAGGTRTRWALAGGRGEIVAEGEARGMSALQVGQGDHVRDALDEIAAAAARHGRPACVHAGMTGFGENIEELRRLVAIALGIDAARVSLASDMEVCYLDLFAPGEGYMVYAGTGSVAAFIDAQGTLHRAGGRGVVVDDGGSGFWIAREALRRIWRLEDEKPGSWRASPMAVALFDAIGGAEWASTREYIYGRDRGSVGRLALAVAKSAGDDPAAREILSNAGVELARLASAMTQRYGPRPVALTGRAAELHPLIAQAMRSTLPAGFPLTQRVAHGQRAAARIALRGAAA